MSFPKLVGFVAIVLFGVIALAALFKGESQETEIVVTGIEEAVEVDLDYDVVDASGDAYAPALEEATFPALAPAAPSDEGLPDGDRISELFNTRGPRLPFVETITYKSRVDWQKGRPAWICDYATHYKTSRHFIARSLNRKPDYFKENVANGDRFNVFKKDKDLSFYLVVDTSRCKMWFYSYEADTNERTLLKTYNVGLGRLDSSEVSGLLTPLGRFTLGEKVAVYKPKKMGIFNGEKTEMVRVFGTRWIPFDKEYDDATDVAKGYGIHGVPWILNQHGDFVAEEDSIGKYESDGCVRLSTDDMEEIFAIVITKPTTIELVRDFSEAHLPGVEKQETTGGHSSSRKANS